LFAVNAGWIRSRFGRTLPAVAGTLLMVVAAGYWALFTRSAPDYPVAFLPGLIAGGMSAGLTQAPLFAAAGTLAPDRAATGSAVLTMARQVGSAIGVAILVTILASGHGISGYQHGFDFIIIVMTACGVTNAAGTFLGRTARVSWPKSRPSAAH